MPYSPLCMFYRCTDMDNRTVWSWYGSERKFLRATTYQEPRKESVILLRLALVCLIALTACPFATADTITFSGTIAGRSLSAEVPILPRGTVSYISLTGLVSTFGGKTTMQTDGVQVDLSDGQAWLKLNETSVNSSLDSFDLRQPVLREGDAILVAVTDVQPLLMKAFGADTTQRINRTPDVTATDLGVNELTNNDQPMPAEDRPPRSRTGEIRLAIIDPGHGGNDAGFELSSGAVAGSEGMKEKDITLAVALKVRGALEKQLGLQVRMSRDEDLMLANKQRVTLANRDQGDILISLHTGASYSPRASGFEIFHSPATSGSNTVAIAESLSDALVEATGTPSRGVREAHLSLFREIEMPGVLIELGFSTNQADVARLVDEAYQQRLAEGIAAGLAPFTRARSAGDTL